MNRISLDGQSVPATVLAAYRNAADRIAVDDPSCGLRWQVLAGIGKVESSHARGGRLNAAGDAVPRILGPVLNGVGSVAAISDHDDGRWDLDTVWDRAVGPMQFIPGTWAAFGVDGSGDGTADPNNVFDATLSAGRYLCAGPSEVRTSAGLSTALRRYNNSAAYVATVMSWIQAYDSGVAVPADDAGSGTSPGGNTSAATQPTVAGTPSGTPSTTPTGTCYADPVADRYRSDSHTCPDADHVLPPRPSRRARHRPRRRRRRRRQPPHRLRRRRRLRPPPRPDSNSDANAHRVRPRSLIDQLAVRRVERSRSRPHTTTSAAAHIVGISTLDSVSAVSSTTVT